jgi:hypothetical protein
VEWIHPAHDREQWRVLIKTFMIFRVPYKAVNLLIGRATISFSRRTLLYGFLVCVCVCMYRNWQHKIYRIICFTILLKLIKCWYQNIKRSRDNSIGIALGYGLDDRCSRVRFPAWAGNFSLHHGVQNGSGAHPASYPRGTRCSFPGGKAAGMWS